MTPYERWRRRVSLAYGNVALRDNSVTRAQVEAAATKLYDPRPAEE